MREEREKREKNPKGKRAGRRASAGAPTPGTVRPGPPLSGATPLGAANPPSVTPPSTTPFSVSGGRSTESRRPASAPTPGTVRTTSCDEMSRLYAVGEMSSTESSDFEAHLAGCNACKELLGEWKGLISALSSSAYDATCLEPSRDFDKPVMAFVKGLIRERRQAEELSRRAAALTQHPAALSQHADALADRAAVISDRALLGERAVGLGDGAGALTQHPAVANAQAEAVTRRRAIWVGVAAMAAVLIVVSEMLSRFAAPGPQLGRPYVLAITWLVDICHKGFDWLVFNFMRGIKIGEIFVQVFEKLQPIWNGLGVAARQLDPQLVVMEVLLLMLSLVLLRGLLSTAPKGRCTNVGIIL